MEKNFKNILAYWSIKDKNQTENSNKKKNDNKSIQPPPTTTALNNTSSVSIGYENFQSVEIQQKSSTIYKPITTSMECMLKDSEISKDNLILTTDSDDNNQSLYSVYNNSGNKVESFLDFENTDGVIGDDSKSIYSVYRSSSSSIFSFERPIGDTTITTIPGKYGLQEQYATGGSRGGYGYDIDSSIDGISNYSGSLYGDGDNGNSHDSVYNSSTYGGSEVYSSTYGGSNSNSNSSSIIDKNDENEQKIKQEKYLQETRYKKKDGRDWNQEFQLLLRLTPSLDKFQKLTFLALDFVNAAENYGFIIIKEMFLENSQKTIKPIDIGGIAGGQKFICQGILFKFAYDTKIGDSYLYGGKYPSETCASKAAGNELKGLSSFFQHVLDNEFADKLNVPLMCIIDYYGYRLIAMSVMQINKKTLIYGSSDGGITMHTDDDELNGIMEKIGNSMNLKGHLTGINPKFMYGPGDLEVHKSANEAINEQLNKQYYVVDFGRLLPPQSYYIDQIEGKSNSRDIFYKMIRPELLKQSEVPLSSDSYSGWSICDPNHLDLNKDIDNLTNRLYNEIIPLAAKELQLEWERLQQNNQQQSIENWDISVESHKYGINLRHLGRIRNLITNQSLRKHILNEMVIRVFKNQIKDEQRVRLTGDKVGSQERCIHIIVGFLNCVIGNDRFDTSKDFWTISIKSLILKKYGNGLSCLGGGLSEEELDIKFDLFNNLNIYQVLSKFQIKTGIKLSSRVKQILKKSDGQKNIRLPVLFYTDIKSIRPVVKHSNMIARSEGISLYMKAVELIYSNQVYYGRKIQIPDFSRFNSDFSEEIGLLEACSQKLALASRSSTTDSSLYHLLGLVDFELLKIKSAVNGVVDVLLKKSSKDKLLQSVRYNETPNNLSSLATILDVCEEYKQSKELYDKMANNMDPSIVVPLLFESASLYSPYYTKITSDKLLGTSFHQFIVIINILLNLPSEHQLVSQYLFDTYKILSVLILRAAFAPNFQIHKPLVSIVCIRNSIEFNHQDIIKETWQLIENAFKFNPTVIDEFIEEASIQYPSRISFVILLKYSCHSATLRSRILEFLKSKPFNQFNSEVLKQIFSHENVLDILTKTLSINTLDFITLKRRYNDFGNQQALETLFLDSLYLDDESYSLFINDLSMVSNQIKSLKVIGGRYLTSNGGEFTIDYSKLNFKSLTSLDIKDNEFPNEFLYSILSSSKLTLINFRLHYYNMPISCLEILGECSNVEKMLLRNTDPKVEVTHIPISIQEITIEQSFSNPLPLEELMKRCKNLKNIILVNVDEIINGDLKSLKSYPINSLDVNSYYDYMNNNNLSEGIELWSKSLTTLKMFSNKPYDKFPQFISQLSLINSLDLRFNIDDSQIQSILKSLKNLETFKIDSNKYHLLTSGSGDDGLIFSESVKKLEISNLSPPFKNLSNIGLIYPKLESLELSYPKNINDVSFRGMIEHLHHITSLSLSCCYDLTDNSIIALCNSPISSNLTHLSVKDFYISDGSIVKIAYSCPKLLRIIIPIFKRPETHSFIRASFPNLIIDF